MWYSGGKYNIMAITYSNFLTQVRNFTEVDSNVLSDTLIDQFIRNVELNVASKVDYDDLRKYSNSTCTASNRAVNLPADLIYLRQVRITDGSNNLIFLEKRDQSFISEFNPDNSTGTPKYYANYDNYNILLAPTPSAAFAIQIQYIKTPPHFNSSTDTILSQYHENMLLYGVLVECFSYLKGPADMYNLYKNKYDEAIQGFVLQEMGGRRRDQYVDGVPRVQIPAPNPR